MRKNSGTERNLLNSPSKGELFSERRSKITLKFKPRKTNGSGNRGWQGITGVVIYYTRDKIDSRNKIEKKKT